MGTKAAGVRVRCTAAKIITAVLTDGQTLTQQLDTKAARAERDQAFLRQLCFGTLRYLLPLRKQLADYLRKPIKADQLEVEVLLLLGLYQIGKLRVPDHAAVSTTVEAARKMGKGWAGKLINAVLRNHLRAGKPDFSSAAGTTHPHWLKDRFRQDWGDQADRIMTANDQQAPLWLRVNARLTTVEALKQKLGDAGIEAAASSVLPGALCLPGGADVSQLPGFATGLFSVQDAAAQLAARLVNPEPGQRVLDACAAPGGKTAHLLELAEDIDLVAVDRSAQRLEKLSQNLERLGLKARVLAADAAEPSSWWDGQPFDTVLLDAPCSATGIIRRHPDIRHLRSPQQVSELIALQSRLLDALWPLLRPGGHLLYVTCSILKAENEAQIAAFCERTATAEALPIDAAWGRATTHGRQILPGENDMDGFFFSRLLKA